MSLTELSSNVKLAREMAVSGNYDSSGIYYETVLEMMQKLILGCVDTTKRGKYTLIQQQLIKEFTKLKELQKVCLVFSFSYKWNIFLKIHFLQIIRH